MFDIGWTEIVSIVILAVLIIGPRDLPKAMRTLAKMIGKAKQMMREFQNNVDDMIKDTELEEVKKSIQSARNFDVKSQITKTIDSDGSIEKGMDLSKEATAFNESMKETPPSQEEKVAAPEKDAVSDQSEKK
jgi:sec-independent protein translocase protein TatB